jgi:hypothetical protein
VIIFRHFLTRVTLLSFYQAGFRFSSTFVRRPTLDTMPIAVSGPSTLPMIAEPCSCHFRGRLRRCRPAVAQSGPVRSRCSARRQARKWPLLASTRDSSWKVSLRWWVAPAAHIDLAPTLLDICTWVSVSIRLGPGPPAQGLRYPFSCPSGSQPERAG